MKISNFFKLDKNQKELDFVDIDIHRDTSLFLDPNIICMRKGELADRAINSIGTFFELLLKFLKSGNKEKAKDLFSYLGEPNETCLGISSGEPRGKGVGKKDFEKIFESLIKSRAVKTGLIEDIEDMKIFVEGFDKDKLSDLTTNIIKKELIEYTIEQCELYDITMEDNVDELIWDSNESEWTIIKTKALFIADKKYILVPKDFVSYSSKYDIIEYMNRFIVTFLQNEHLKLNSTLVRYSKNKGRFVTKKDIIDDIKSSKTRSLKNFVVDFTNKHPEIFKNFKEWCKANYNNDQFEEENIQELVEFLKDKLIKTSKGMRDASNYHNLIIGILTLIFEKKLSHPIKEKEINNGRKRIDLTFDNTADEGFFFRGANTHQAKIIMVECKNYTYDIKNPELDQLSGRFSPSRGKLGFLICREIDNYEHTLKSCQDTHKDDRGIIIVLEDRDIIALLNFAKNNETKYKLIDEYIQKKYSMVVNS